MLNNYFRIALRNLARNKFSGSINIGGLAIGMAVAILVGLWIYDELSFDRGIKNHDRIAAVLQNQNISNTIETWWGEARQLAPILRKDYSGQIKYAVTATGTQDQLFTWKEKKLKPSPSKPFPELVIVLKACNLPDCTTYAMAATSNNIFFMA